MIESHLCSERAPREQQVRKQCLQSPLKDTCAAGGMDLQERELTCVCVCVCIWVCVCVYVGVCVCACVCVSEKERVYVSLPVCSSCPSRVAWLHVSSVSYRRGEKNHTPHTHTHTHAHTPHTHKNIRSEEHTSELQSHL